MSEPSKLSNSIANFWIEYLEQPLELLGLDNKWKRFFVVSSFSALIIWLIKPVGLFNEKGKPYSWLLTDRENPNAVPLNWLTLSLFIGGLSVLFI